MIKEACFGMVFLDHSERVFEASELADGASVTALLGARFSGYRLPPFVALNEPATGLHPAFCWRSATLSYAPRNARGFGL